MLGIPRKYSHFVYGLIQSCLTCAIAAGIASLPFLTTGDFAGHWVRSWLLAWLTMLPVVLFAAPGIRRLADALTCLPRGEAAEGGQISCDSRR